MATFRACEKNDVTDVVLCQRFLPVSISVTAKVVLAVPAEVAGAVIAGNDPGPEASLGKLLATDTMARTSEVARLLLGRELTSDSGGWGTFAWSEHLLGAPGYRIAGGTDEIQHNIIAERVLGLPREPRP